MRFWVRMYAPSIISANSSERQATVSRSNCVKVFSVANPSYSFCSAGYELHWIVKTYAGSIAVNQVSCSWSGVRFFAFHCLSVFLFLIPSRSFCCQGVYSSYNSVFLDHGFPFFSVVIQLGLCASYSDGFQVPLKRHSSMSKRRGV